MVKQWDRWNLGPFSKDRRSSLNLISSFYSFLIKYLWKSYFMSSTVLGARESKINKLHSLSQKEPTVDLQHFERRISFPSYSWGECRSTREFHQFVRNELGYSKKPVSLVARPFDCFQCVLVHPNFLVWVSTLGCMGCRCDLKLWQLLKGNMSFSVGHEETHSWKPRVKGSLRC